MATSYGQTKYQLPVDDDGTLLWPPLDKSGHRMQARVAETWRAVLEVLHDGPITDTSGQATQVLFSKTRAAFRRIHHRNMTAPTRGGFHTSVLMPMYGSGLLDREHNGKRTHRISLAVAEDQLPASWFAQEATTDDTAASEASREEATTVEATSTPMASEGFEAAFVDATPDVDYEALAITMLQQVVKVITTPSTNGDEHGALSLQLEHVTKERDRFRDRVHVLERDLAVQTGLTKVARFEQAEATKLLQHTEANLQRVLRQVSNLGRSSDALTDQERQTIDRLMRLVPVGPNSHGDD